METVLVVPRETPAESKKIQALRRLVKRAGIAEHQEARRLKTMVATMRHMKVSLAIIVEPRDLGRLRERIGESRTAKARANAALRRLHEEADSLPVRGNEPLRRDTLRDPIFIVIAQKKIPARQLPDDVLSFALENEDGIVAAIRKAHGNVAD